MFVRDRLEDGHHCLDDGLSILGQLVKNARHHLVQFGSVELRRRAGRPAPVPIYPALPDLLLPRPAFQHLPVEAGSMLLTDDLSAVGVAVVEFCSALMGHHLFAAPLV